MEQSDIFSPHEWVRNRSKVCPYCVAGDIYLSDNECWQCGKPVFAARVVDEEVDESRRVRVRECTRCGGGFFPESVEQCVFCSAGKDLLAWCTPTHAEREGICLFNRVEVINSSSVFFRELGQVLQVRNAPPSPGNELPGLMVLLDGGVYKGLVWFSAGELRVLPAADAHPGGCSRPRGAWRS